MAQCVRSTLTPSRTPQSLFTRTVSSAKTQAFASVSFLRTLPEFKRYPKQSSVVMSCQGKSQSQQQLSLDDLVTSNRKGEVLGTIKDSLSNCLSDTNLLETVPGLKSRIKGKVRDIYDAGDYLVLITTDRLSAFDRNLASIPFKGQVLNETSLWWFNNTQHITPNAIVSSPDRNVVIAKKCSVFPIEFVVRGYVTGSTDTSLWTVYNKGVRNYCGNELSDGLVKNQKLPANILTPTTKAEDHDVPISPTEIVEGGFMTQAEFDEASMKALSLFEFGQRVAKEHGLILVDTKYEFGKSSDGSILLIDEIHTPDSSRYWLAGSYEERFQKGLEPENVDKEFLRLWFKENSNPYEDEVLPAAPAELVTELAWRYIFLYETITGSRIDILPTQEPIHDRISRNTSQALLSLRQL
ncbi:Phosphoribosylaminoimidazole-succinocarboxamide synthase [Hirschfeldia incana]|nr:Phosphoribosylaminoimidazole-succinocarboxamide synthase [Hirschfeldia incana]